MPVKRIDPNEDGAGVGSKNNWEDSNSTWNFCEGSGTFL